MPLGSKDYMAIKVARYNFTINNAKVIRSSES